LGFKEFRVPKVSVIVPNYNHARFLRRRIESILRQTFQDFELILLDDCSTDESRSILSSYAGDPRVRLEFNEVNSGSAFKQWNKGLRLARGDYVWIAESDDCAEERFLGRLVALLDANSDVAFAYCRSWRLSHDDKVDGFADSYLRYLDENRWTADFCSSGDDECRSYLVVYNTVPNASAALFRKMVYERVGGADENYRLCGDWKLWAAMALTGRVAYLGEPLNYFRFHGQSVRDTSGLAVNAIESLRVSRWLINQITPSETVREKMCVRHAKLWVPALMSAHVPFGMKRQILREVRVIDPHPFRHAIRPAAVTFQLKLARHLAFFRPRGIPRSSRNADPPDAVSD
jgi:hypothetical protein